ncbi:MAG TPA: nucleotidyltransferase family protein, partial [Thermoanaerobaculia bacterium]|nr:nucleotidyltransferase family protein [Thermoanaerobaculia bacterium]
FHLGYERRGAVVEVHWDIDSSSPPGFVDRLWEASRAAGEEGETLRVLSPEHQLLFGCLHLSRHAFHGGLRWLADLRLQLPVDPDVALGFEREAREWPARAVRCPLWVLTDHGVAEAAALGGEAWADSMDRALLRRFMVPLLVAEPWMGVPAWRMEKALRVWLFSGRSLPGLIAEVSGQGMSGRLRSWAVGATDPV